MEIIGVGGWLDSLAVVDIEGGKESRRHQRWIDNGLKSWERKRRHQSIKSRLV